MRSLVTPPDHRAPFSPLTADAASVASATSTFLSSIITPSRISGGDGEDFGIGDGDQARDRSYARVTEVPTSSEMTATTTVITPSLPTNKFSGQEGENKCSQIEMGVEEIIERQVALRSAIEKKREEIIQQWKELAIQEAR